MIFDRLIRRAERQPWIIPVAAVNLGFGIGNALQGHDWAWFFISVGVTLTLIRPVGTGWRRRRMLRQTENLIEQVKRERWGGGNNGPH